MVTVSMGAVDEKFATTRTGELTVDPVLGETMVRVCPQAKIDAKTNAKKTRVRGNDSTKHPPGFFWRRARVLPRSRRSVLDQVGLVKRERRVVAQTIKRDSPATQE
jgi:hypothetical protein